VGPNPERPLYSLHHHIALFTVALSNSGSLALSRLRLVSLSGLLGGGCYSVGHGLSIEFIENRLWRFWLPFCSMASYCGPHCLLFSRYITWDVQSVDSSNTFCQRYASVFVSYPLCWLTPSAGSFQALRSSQQPSNDPLKTLH